MGAEEISRYERKAHQVQHLVAREQARLFELDRVRCHAKQSAQKAQRVFLDAREKLLSIANGAEIKPDGHFMRDQVVSQLLRARHEFSTRREILREAESRCSLVLQGVQREQARLGALVDRVQGQYQARLENTREAEQEEVEALFAAAVVAKDASSEMNVSSVQQCAEAANRGQSGGGREHAASPGKGLSVDVAAPSVSSAKIRAEQVQDLAIVAQGEERQLTLNYVTTHGETVRVALNRFDSGAITVAVVGEGGRSDRGAAEQKQRLRQKLSAAGIPVQSITIGGVDALE